VSVPERLTSPTLPFVMMWPGMMPTLASPGVIRPGQLGPMSRVCVRVEKGAHLHHVHHGDAFGDADHQIDASVGGLDDGVGGKARRHVDDAGVGACRHDGVAHGVEDWHVAKGPFAALARGDAADNRCAVVDHLLGVKRSLTSGDALHDEARVLSD
jgi:hypothetical protein